MFVAGVSIRSKADLAKLATADLLQVFNARAGRRLKTAASFSNRDELIEKTWDAIEHDVTHRTRSAAS